MYSNCTKQQEDEMKQQRSPADVIDAEHTHEELTAMLGRMRKASDDFYGAAMRTECHAFIEFTGLMNEFIRVCEEAVAAGQDFTTCNTHSGNPLPMKPWHAGYLAEKIKCIYGPVLARDPEARRAFLGKLGLLDSGGVENS
jgi:hypothetical protein